MKADDPKYRVYTTTEQAKDFTFGIGKNKKLERVQDEEKQSVAKVVVNKSDKDSKTTTFVWKFNKFRLTPNKVS